MVFPQFRRQDWHLSGSDPSGGEGEPHEERRGGQPRSSPTGPNHGTMGAIFGTFVGLDIVRYILVGGLEHFLFSMTYGIILPID